MSEDRSDSTERVRRLNDAFRRSFVGGVVVVTAAVAALSRERRSALLAKIRAFAFTEDNDPHGSTTSASSRTATFSASGRSICMIARWSSCLRIRPTPRSRRAC